MADEIEHRGCRIIIAGPELVFLVCPQGRHYETFKGEHVIERAKRMTDCYWDEVAMFGEALYPEHWENLRKRGGEGKC